MKPESNLGKPWLGLRRVLVSNSTIIILLFSIRLLIHSSTMDHYGE
jgi:hypothetical protein